MMNVLIFDSVVNVDRGRAVALAQSFVQAGDRASSWPTGVFSYRGGGRTGSEVPDRLLVFR